jgi:hypothetical protein
LADRKKKHAEVKKRMDEEIEELKSGHEVEWIFYKAFLSLQVFVWNILEIFFRRN